MMRQTTRERGERAWGGWNSQARCEEGKKIGQKPPWHVKFVLRKAWQTQNS